jgi:hypothetical protein
VYTGLRHSPVGSGPTDDALEYITSSGHVASPESSMWWGWELLVAQSHYWNRVLCRVSIHSTKTILHSAKPLPSVTLGKEHSANILSAKGSLPSTFFGHSAKTLPSVEKYSAKKNTRQIKNRKKQKNSKTFFKL